MSEQLIEQVFGQVLQIRMLPKKILISKKCWKTANKSKKKVRNFSNLNRKNAVG